MFWNATFPEIEVKYTVSNGFPAVVQCSGSHLLKLADMDDPEAVKYTYVKLGGIAAEIIMFNQHSEFDMFSDFVTTDFYSGESGLDCQDNEIHCGDFSENPLDF